MSLRQIAVRNCKNTQNNPIIYKNIRSVYARPALRHFAAVSPCTNAIVISIDERQSSVHRGPSALEDHSSGAIQSGARPCGLAPLCKAGTVPPAAYSGRTYSPPLFEPSSVLPPAVEPLPEPVLSPYCHRLWLGSWRCRPSWRDCCLRGAPWRAPPPPSTANPHPSGVAAR